MPKFFAAFFESLRKMEIGLLDEGLYLFLLDFDECNNGSHDCLSNATCINTAGYFECKCKDGYIGDGRNCTGKDQLKHIVFSIYFKYFWPCNFKKIISQLLFIVPYKAIPYWTGQKFKFQKKISSVSGNP